MTPIKLGVWWVFDVRKTDFFILTMTNSDP